MEIMEPKKYLREELIKFTSQKEIASGGFSKVYRGQLDGRQVAIKVLENDVAESFEAEMKTMAMASHPNLVTLYGYCSDSNIKALVYEFMKNGSLDKILFYNELSLEWGVLYEIALGTAKGLAYLHDGCGKQIIHRDIKPANVLVDENLSAKITDFGLAKLISTDANHYTITNQKRGTDGYVAPEFGRLASKITKKCDVYSFGVTLFEVLRKRRNHGRGEDWFPLQVWTKFTTGKLDELIESFGIPETHKGKAKILSMVAFWCSQYTVETRPSMINVVEVLENEISVKTPPYPFQEYFPAPDTSMLPSPEVNLDIQSEASNVVHENLAISNPTLVGGPDVFINAFNEKESKKSSEFEKLPSELGTTRPQQFSLSDLERFRSKFPEKIGSGGYGVVYKGQFQDGMEVAIKILHDMEAFDQSFMNVVMTLEMVNHPNIVKLHGYCFDDHMKALVYEYIGNGSLDTILYGKYHLHIEWEQLYEIVIETAKGLSVLHAAGIVHHDIKASNILLNGNLSPKIRSYGLKGLIIMKGDGDATRMAGSSASDVYSFGMLLFEVLGRRSVNHCGPEEGFPHQVWKMFDEGLLGKVIKDCGIDKKDRKKAFNLSKVALWCAQFDPRERPSMSLVVKMLEMKIPVVGPPNPFPYTQLSSTSASLEASPRFNSEASPSIEQSFHEKVSLVENSKRGGELDQLRDLHSMLNLFEKKCPPGGEKSVVLYTTVGWQDRFTECNYVRSILKLHQVVIIERDISAGLDHWVDLRELLGRTEVPALFVHGRFIGGVNEVKRLEEEGKLKLLLYAVAVEGRHKHKRGVFSIFKKRWI